MAASKGFTFTFDDMTLEPIDEGYLTESDRDLGYTSTAYTESDRELGSFAPARDDSFARGHVVGARGGASMSGGTATTESAVGENEGKVEYRVGSATGHSRTPSGGGGGKGTTAPSHRDMRGSVTSSQATPKMRTVGKGPVGATYTANDRVVNDPAMMRTYETAPPDFDVGGPSYFGHPGHSGLTPTNSRSLRSVGGGSPGTASTAGPGATASTAGGGGPGQSQLRSSASHHAAAADATGSNSRMRTSDRGQGPDPTMRASQIQSRSVLVQDAERGMDEMRDLLEKMSAGTATRSEKERLEKLNAQLSVMKEEVERSMTRDVVTGSAVGAAAAAGAGGASRRQSEVDALRSQAEYKAMSLVRNVKIKEARSVIRAVCAAESVDLAFVVDCTKSMQPYIDGVKSSIKGIVRQIEATNGNLRLRLAVVGYRDVKDATRFEVLDFVTDIDRFESFVGGLIAMGGYDHPEDMAGGIQRTNGLHWRHPTRVAFIIADSPCHGREFHPFRDDFENGTPGIDIVRELRQLRDRHEPQGTMNLAFGSITEHTNQMLERLHNAYGIRLKSLPIEEASKISTAVTRTVRKSIFKTMTITVGAQRNAPGGMARTCLSFAPPSDPHTLMKTFMSDGGGAGAGNRKRQSMLKKFNIIPGVPPASEWKRCPALKVQVYRNTAITNMRDLRAPLGFGVCKNKKAMSMSNLGDGPSAGGHRRTSSSGSPDSNMTTKTNETTHSTMFMRRAPNPFAQGEIRIAFYGQLAQHPDELHLPKNFMVMKSYKHIGEGVHDRLQYLRQMEVNNIVHFLADAYNASEARPSRCATVHCLPVCVVEEEASTREKVGERRFCVEPPLPSGKFVKFSNNTGYWNEDVLDETLLRFTEWTYKVTEGYLMVTDLQGVRHGSKYHLTDPAILCRDIIRFGNTNLGEGFMRKCVDSTRAYMVERGWEKPWAYMASKVAKQHSSAGSSSGGGGGGTSRTAGSQARQGSVRSQSGGRGGRGEGGGRGGGPATRQGSVASKSRPETRQGSVSSKSQPAGTRQGSVRSQPPQAAGRGTGGGGARSHVVGPTGGPRMGGANSRSIKSSVR